MLLYDNIETSRTEINRQADAAMGECKEAGRNRDSFYVIFMIDATDLRFWSCRRRHLLCSDTCHSL